MKNFFARLTALFTVFSLLASAPVGYGVIFPNTTSSGNTYRFQFTSTALLPFYPATYIWQYAPFQQTGYYAVMFYAQNDGNYLCANKFYGTHPYPFNGNLGTVHNFEIAINCTDDTTDVGGHQPPRVTKGTYTSPVWYTQGVRVLPVNANDLQVDFFYNLPDTTYKITTTQSNYRTTPPTPALFFGGVPWSVVGEERGSGIFRGLQIYDTSLSVVDMRTESQNNTTNSAQTTKGQAHLWYMNQNLTPADIADKKTGGTAHNPAYVGTGKLELWPIPAAIPSVVSGGSATGFSSSAGTTISTGNMTCSGNNRALYVWVGAGASTPRHPAVGQVKWGGSGGTALTKLDSVSTTSFGRFSLWRLKAPTAQTSTVSVTFPTSQDERLVIGVCLQDVNQTTSEGATHRATGSSPNPLNWPASDTLRLALNGHFWVDGSSSAYTISTAGFNGFPNRQSLIAKIDGASMPAEGLQITSEPGMPDSASMASTITGTPGDGWASLGVSVIGQAPASNRWGVFGNNDNFLLKLGF